jgi:hypothetical protein
MKAAGRNIGRKILLGVGLLIVLAALGFVAWAQLVPPPMAEATAALTSDAAVTVTTDRWLTFTPTGAAPTTGFVFYPGGRVDARAYAPAGRELAAAGYLVVIAPMPLHLAVFAPNAAAAVIAAHPEIGCWEVGGHSLGGAMAASYAAVNPVGGLVLWAAYPAASADLSAAELAVVSISASGDGLATPAKIAASRPLLPPDTTWVVIAGGNHAQFGWYGPQAGDGAATISRAAQAAQTVAATAANLAACRR